jgi:hypothetical protein
MQDIEREAMDIQLQDKLLEYKQSMGMLGAGTPPESKQIASGTPAVDNQDVLDQVIVNEAGETGRSN